MVAVGCDIATRVDLPDGRAVRAGVSLNNCNRRGKVGLISYQTPAVWRNFHVSPATKADLLRLMDGKTLASLTNCDYETRNPQCVHYWDPDVDEHTPIAREALSRKIDVSITPISQLQLSSFATGPQYASVHGIVRLISPVTYVEDSTGSIVVSSYDQPALAVGDEVVISGNISRQSGQLELRNGRVQIPLVRIARTPSSDYSRGSCLGITRRTIGAHKRYSDSTN